MERPLNGIGLETRVTGYATPSRQWRRDALLLKVNRNVTVLWQ